MCNQQIFGKCYEAARDGYTLRVHEVVDTLSLFATVPHAFTEACSWLFATTRAHLLKIRGRSEAADAILHHSATG